MLCCLLAPTALAQTITVKGVVIDAVHQEPVIGATVMLVEDTSKGMLTNLDGEFTLSGVPANGTIRISYVGYKTIDVPINGQTYLHITIQEDNELLDEVVVTALGIKRSEKALSYNVQELKTEDLTTVKEPNFINALNGRVAGVQINKSGSGVGGAARVVMRGAKSIEGSNNVLYVVDGMPLFNTSVGADSGRMGEGRVASEGIADFNPEDIASISVLSGPSAAALYGSSAANGAILITTKKGVAGAPKLTISSSLDFSTPFVMPRFQQRYGNRPGEFESWGEMLSEPSTYDPAKDFFRTGVNAINSVSLSTGSETNQTYISIATTNAGGIVPNNDYERYNFAVNNNTQFFDGALELGLGAQYIKQKDRNMVSQGEYWNPIVAAYLFPRGEDFEAIKTFERWDGTRNIPVQYWPVSEGRYGAQNPYWSAYRNLSTNNKDRYIFNTSLTYHFADWINIAGRFRLDKSNTRFERKLYATTHEKWAKSKGNYEYIDTHDQQTYADVMVNINKQLGDFNIVANVGGSYSDFRADGKGLGGPLQLVPNLFTVGNINPSEYKPHESGGDTPVRNLALFASFEAGYKNMVYLTLTGRNDWNSRLVHSKEPSFFYPSVGLSALLSEMVDMGQYVDMLKVRGSFTEVGSPVSRIGMTPGTYTDEISGGVIIPNTIYPFGDFKAERTRSYELGLEAKLFKSFSANLTWYHSNTYNQTFIGDMPESSGYTNAYLQAGNVQNQGIEATLSFNKSWGDLRWNTSLTYSRNKNEIKEMVKDYKHPDLDTVFDIPEVKKGATILKVGGSINDIYANTFFKKDGNGYVYLPENGKYTLEAGDPVYLGKTTPDFNMGWNNSFYYKGIGLSFLFNGRFGGVVTSSTQAILDRFGVSEDSAIARDNGGALLPGQGRVNAEEYYKLIGTGDSELMGYYTYDATNVRLQQLAISYTMPSEWFKGYIQGLTMTFTGNNLWMLYNKAPHDPELTPTTGTYGIGNDFFMQPSLRSYGFNIKLDI
ncbi:MAG: SusC/RagA family TonB-linked outer membrane protein [Porphyromonas sp.]|nr:SusC/RagA family TonB-linked outer membrane protein [Porphyromonas sp.]